MALLVMIGVIVIELNIMELKRAIIFIKLR